MVFKTGEKKMKPYIHISKINFLIGDSYSNELSKNKNGFYLTQDKSLLYQSTTKGDYSILLGGNWRFELIVDSSTALCVKFQCFLDELKASRKSLILPKSNAKNVIIRSDDKLFSGEGCHYYPFEDNAHWDESKKILCIGNPDSIGEAVEFTPGITVVLKNHQLVCLYLKLNNISNNDFCKLFK